MHISIRHKANPTEKMTDQAIIEALLNHDEELTRQFFFHDCRPLFCSIIRHVFSYEVDYDEFVNELYLHLMERDGARLRQFEGRSSLYQWFKVVAIRYFIAKRNRMIDPASEEALLEKSEHHCADRPETRMIASIDLENLLAGMANKRQSYVLRRLMIDDAERNKGYGSEMLILILGELLNQEVAKILLHVNGANKVAHVMYSHHGFVSEEQIDYWGEN